MEVTVDKNMLQPLTFVERRPLILRNAAVALLLLIGLFGWGTAQLPGPNPAADNFSRAVFDQNGTVHLPEAYRRWANVGTRYKASGYNILDGAPIVTPQVMNTYVEPSALDYYKKIGKWPDGAQIVKELSNIRVGKGCDNVTNICSSPIGPGIFQETYIGVGMMVKDRNRFPDAPGNWGYFGFFRHSTYERLAKLRPQNQCASCHVKLASDTDYVITKAHLGLSQGNIQ
jgi:hypothetical protein